VNGCCIFRVADAGDVVREFGILGGEFGGELGRLIGYMLDGAYGLDTDALGFGGKGGLSVLYVDMGPDCSEGEGEYDWDVMGVDECSCDERGECD